MNAKEKWFDGFPSGFVQMLTMTQGWTEKINEYGRSVPKGTFIKHCPNIHFAFLSIENIWTSWIRSFDLNIFFAWGMRKTKGMFQKVLFKFCPKSSVRKDRTNSILEIICQKIKILIHCLLLDLILWNISRKPEVIVRSICMGSTLAQRKTDKNLDVKVKKLRIHILLSNAIYLG